VIHVEMSETIRAAPAKVAGTFRDYRTWPRLFPATIRGVGLVGNERGIEMLEIDHVEGKVIKQAPGRVLKPHRAGGVQEPIRWTF
jgi:hypothetical protein